MHAKLLLPVLFFSTYFLSCQNKSSEEKAMNIVALDQMVKVPEPPQKKEQHQKIPVGNLNQNAADSSATQSQASPTAHEPAV